MLRMHVGLLAGDFSAPPWPPRHRRAAENVRGTLNMGKIKKILLVKPMIRTSEIQPPLGLMYLAAGVENGYQVSILDLPRLHDTRARIFEDFVRTEKPDIIGAQCYTVELSA